MPTDIRAYRVFIASPGGLQEERKAFRDAIEAYNQAEAIHRSVLFIPVGWEDTLGGVGRPQSLINEDVRGCDYFVLILWDRWGTPPDNEGKFTSGTEEEFHVAMECLRDANVPMSQIVVFFKAVDPQQLTDPGPQLTKVLDFRKSLEANKEHLYHTFDTVNTFEKLITRHLGVWLRRDEQQDDQRSEGKTDLPPDSTTNLERTREEVIPSASGSGELDEAWRLADKGHRTEAETMFARAIVRGTDPWAFIEFGRFLDRDGRLDQAIVMFERARELAAAQADLPSESAALRRIGRILITRGDFKRAEETILQSLRIAETAGWQQGVGSCYRDLSIVLRHRGDLDRAEEMLRKAIKVTESVGQMDAVASAYSSLGLVFQTRGDLDGAEHMLRKALEIDQGSERLDAIAIGYGNLGMVLYARGDLDNAEEMLRKALEINETLGRLDGLATNYGNLGLIYEARRDLDKAEQMHQKALQITEKLGNLASTASECANLGNVLEARGDLTGAEQMHRRSLAIEEQLGRPEGIAISYVNLGDLAFKQGHRDQAHEYFSKALQLFEQVGIPVRAHEVRKRLQNLA